MIITHSSDIGIRNESDDGRRESYWYVLGKHYRCHRRIPRYKRETLVSAHANVRNRIARVLEDGKLNCDDALCLWTWFVPPAICTGWRESRQLRYFLPCFLRKTKIFLPCTRPDETQNMEEGRCVPSASFSEYWIGNFILVGFCSGFINLSCTIARFLLDDAHYQYNHFLTNSTSDLGVRPIRDG